MSSASRAAGRHEIGVVVRCSDLPGTQWTCYSGVEIGVQVGHEVVGSVPAAGDGLELRAMLQAARDPAGGFDFYGPAVHGKRGERFLYLVWSADGQAGRDMFRRAKLQLLAIDPALIERAIETGRPLKADFQASNSRGPACATIKAPGLRWTV